MLFEGILSILVGRRPLFGLESQPGDTLAYQLYRMYNRTNQATGGLAA